VIEGRFKAICPYASQFVVHGGDNRNFCTAVVTLDPDAISAWADHHGMSGRPYSEVVTSQPAREMVQGYVDELNSALNRWETIKKFIVLDHDLTVESGELTPSMKVKRRIVENNYRDRLDALYS
jgi:long-chain acyl-CoA synthetase